MTNMGAACCLLLYDAEELVPEYIVSALKIKYQKALDYPENALGIQFDLLEADTEVSRADDVPNDPATFSHSYLG